MQRENYEDLAATIRRGGVTLSEQGNTSNEHPVWVKYAHGMAPVSVRLPSGAPGSFSDIGSVFSPNR